MKKIEISSFIFAYNSSKMSELSDIIRCIEDLILKDENGVSDIEDSWEIPILQRVPFRTLWRIVMEMPFGSFALFDSNNTRYRLEVAKDEKTKKLTNLSNEVVTSQFPDWYVISVGCYKRVERS